ncbi:VOC family protein [Paenibacillus radicis (ex Xue et al. 2023)]|uniref:VOC family protein n=1 Tax=Paenibacillus radicis (ex Xue et al. 2023) TaxID=2972489 RepID=A0ABT1YSA1_9BACL|nr:VOC family protein [Paenibacillus radicis (ex Xue et al. 2023)]MCR8635173.1 VOC family protein [Paenibacillus radicis (ex Xue et al. 2023)]
MAKHAPYIFSEDARSQAEFYTKALGGEIQSIMTYGNLPNANEANKDRIMHLSLMAAGVNILMCDSLYEPIRHGNAIHLCLEFSTEAEAREAFDKLAEGGNIKHPLGMEFWGAMFGQIEDKFGVLWMITTEPKSQS